MGARRSTKEKTGKKKDGRKAVAQFRLPGRPHVTDALAVLA
jgi:hypothetical protein